MLTSPFCIDAVEWKHTHTLDAEFVSRVRQMEASWEREKELFRIVSLTTFIR